LGFWLPAFIVAVSLQRRVGRKSLQAEEGSGFAIKRSNVTYRPCYATTFDKKAWTPALYRSQQTLRFNAAFKQIGLGSVLGKNNPDKATTLRPQGHKSKPS
jgi:hypothetical protein